VIDDGSTDDTAAVAAGLTGPGVRLISFAVNRGRAFAIEEGFAQAAGTAVAVMDSDGQYDPDDLAPMLAVIAGGADVANGWRVSRADSAMRRLVSGVYNSVLMRGLLGVRSRDANSGLKIFRAASLPALGYDPTGFRRGHRYLVAWAQAAGCVWSTCRSVTAPAPAAAPTSAPPGRPGGRSSTSSRSAGCCGASRSPRGRPQRPERGSPARGRAGRGRRRPPSR
jgi:hypothetical protein